MVSVLYLGTFLYHTIYIFYILLLCYHSPSGKALSILWPYNGMHEVHLLFQQLLGRQA